ncbi:HAD family hydrolase [uncultured Methylophaga sp.]|uniref:HAD family hydrolase n=1 Tax=uncultured Methylophaga sp. TaxID=285271 RepID=UPI0030DBB15F
MKIATDKLFALDFDGVICDSAIETGITGWQVATQLWQDMPENMPEQVMIDFRYVRPVMETGFEAILICRLLFEGLKPELLMTDFPRQIDAILLRDNIDTSELKKRFGEYRDNWIENDFLGWINMNPLYTGIDKLLQQIPLSQLFIITTKQERFVQAILQANHQDIIPTHIYGLDRKLKKPQILSDLQQSHPQSTILFIEDRLPTLLDVINTPTLSTIQLYFANWGYNTTNDMQAARQNPRINALDTPSLSDVKCC